MGLSRALWLAAWTCSAGCFYSWEDGGKGAGPNTNSASSAGGDDGSGAAGGGPGSGAGNPSSSVSAGGASACSSFHDCPTDAYCEHACSAPGTCATRTEECEPVSVQESVVCDCEGNVIPSACFAERSLLGPGECVAAADGHVQCGGSDCVFDPLAEAVQPQYCLVSLEASGGKPLEAACVGYNDNCPYDLGPCDSECWAVADLEGDCSCVLHNGVAIVSCVVP